MSSPVSPDREPARIIIAEDEPSIRILYERVLVRSGHLVIASFSTLSEAESGILELAPDDAHFGIFDGNLSKGDRSGKDGEHLVQLFKAQVPDALAIGISGTGEVIGADASFSKPVDIHELAGFIDQNFPPA